MSDGGEDQGAEEVRSWGGRRRRVIAVSFEKSRLARAALPFRQATVMVRLGQGRSQVTRADPAMSGELNIGTHLVRVHPALVLHLRQHGVEVAVQAHELALAVVRVKQRGGVHLPVSLVITNPCRHPFSHQPQLSSPSARHTLNE